MGWKFSSFPVDGGFKRIIWQLNHIGIQKFCWLYFTSKAKFFVFVYGFENFENFVDKNKNVRKLIAVSFEEVAGKVTPTIDNDQREKFHEFLRAYTDIFTKNVYSNKDYTFHNLRKLMNNENLAIVSGDKDSCVVVMNRND